MLIKFSVLWVEDNDAWFENAKRTLKRYLDKLGFHLEVHRIEDPRDVNISDFLKKTSNYDLMLVDWQFRTTGGVDEALGGEVIKNIRDQVSYSDIIFYSGSPKITDEFNSQDFQGVYLAGRRHLTKEAKDLINYLLHKTLHPKIMRGIIVSSLSEIDDLCFQIIEAKYNAKGVNQKTFATSFRKSILTQAKKQLRNKEKATKAKDDAFIQSLHSTMLIDSHKRSEKIVKLAEGDDLDEALLGPIKSLPGTIIKRNWLAHWKRTDETDQKIILVCKGKPNYDFDQAEAVVMRKGINQAATALKGYLEKLTAASSAE